MESDTMLNVSLKHNKPIGMDIDDCIVRSKIMEMESEQFFKEFLHDSESNKLSDQQSTKENDLLPYVDIQNVEKYGSNMMLPDKNTETECEMPFFSTSNFIENSNMCLVQPIITMKTLYEITKTPISSVCDTQYWKIVSQDSNKTPVEIISQSIQNALDLLTYTLFDNSKLIDAIISWDDPNNLVRYFADLICNLTESNEFGFTCREHVLTFVQKTAFKILDDHHMYNSICVEYQCNLLSKFYYNKYIRWNTINLLINRLKIDLQIVSSSNCNLQLRSIFYTFHLIDKMLNKIDFIITTTIKSKECLTDLWKINHTNKSDSEMEILEQMSKEWRNLLEFISMEALRKNIFLVSKRANQCLDSLKSITIK